MSDYNISKSKGKKKGERNPNAVVYHDKGKKKENQSMYGKFVVSKSKRADYRIKGSFFGNSSYNYSLELPERNPNNKWRDNVQYDVMAYFHKNRGTFRKSGASDSEARKARTWVFFLIFLQLLVCLIYGVVVSRYFPITFWALILAAAFIIYYGLKLISVVFFIIRSNLFFTPCIKPKYDVEQGERHEPIVVCIPVANEDSENLQSTISSVARAKYPKDKLVMFFIVEGANNFQKLLNILQRGGQVEGIPNEKDLKHGIYEGIHWSVYLKDTPRGNRDSKWLFVEVIKEMKNKPTYVMFLASDTYFDTDALLWMTKALRNSNNKVAGVTGKLKVANFGKIGRSPLDILYNLSTMTILGCQSYELHFNQIFTKQAEGAYGAVTWLNGNFSMYKREFLENPEPDKSNLIQDKEASRLYNFFSKPIKGIIERNLHELGGDKAISLKLLEQGYSTIYESRALGHTICPDSLKDLILQRRRWNNVNFASYIYMLTNPRLFMQLRTSLVMIFTLFDFLGSYLMPANSVLFLFAIWEPVVTAATATFHFHFSITELIAWWVAIQLVVIAVTHVSTSDMFFAISSFFSGCLMICSVYFYFKQFYIGEVLKFVAHPSMNYPQLVLLLIFPAVHLIVSIANPLMFLIGVFYYLMLPTITVTIPLYSFFHLDDFTWGTRAL